MKNPFANRFFSFFVMLPLLEASTLISQETKTNFVVSEIVPLIPAIKQKAKDGDANAQFILAFLHKYSGQESNAFMLLETSAQKGHPGAQYYLGHCFLEGDGTLVNETKARHWFQKASEQGHADAQYNLGVMMNEGTGGMRDVKGALKWYELAARQGNAYAQLNLAYCLGKGEGVAMNQVAALGWAILAKGGGAEGAEHIIETLNKKLSSDEKQKSETFARSFKCVVTLKNEFDLTQYK